jgi:hypothetical protein
MRRRLLCDDVEILADRGVEAVGKKRFRKADRAADILGRRLSRHQCKRHAKRRERGCCDSDFLTDSNHMAILLSQTSKGRNPTYAGDIRNRSNAA